MRKLFLFMMVSLDGFFEGENHDLSWHNVDSEFNDFAIKQLQETDALFFGRRTYEMMANFWPTKHAREADPVVADFMNAAKKIVFSKTLKKSDWKNTTTVSENVVEYVRRIQAQKGKAIAILGSSNLCVSLIENNLIDEFRIMVNPVVIGKGTPLFYGLKKKLPLQLLRTDQFNSGNVLLKYQRC